MSRTRINLTIDQEVKNQFEDSVDNMSEATEEMWREHLDNEPDRPPQAIVDETRLTVRQEPFLRYVISQGQSKKTDLVIGATQKSLYSGKEYAKKALKFFDTADGVPLKMSDGEMLPENVECRCGASASATLLMRRGDCPSCEADFVFQ